MVLVPATKILSVIIANLAKLLTMDFQSVHLAIVTKKDRKVSLAVMEFVTVKITTLRARNVTNAGKIITGFQNV